MAEKKVITFENPTKQVTIYKDENLLKENIKKGVSIEGITGTLESKKEEETKTIDITTNGMTTVEPTSGKTLSSVVCNVNVPTGGQVVDPGFTFSYSTNGTNTITITFYANSLLDQTGEASGIYLYENSIDFTLSESGLASTNIYVLINVEPRQTGYVYSADINGVLISESQSINLFNQDSDNFTMSLSPYEIEASITSVTLKQSKCLYSSR